MKVQDLKFKDKGVIFELPDADGDICMTIDKANPDSPYFYFDREQIEKIKSWLDKTTEEMSRRGGVIFSDKKQVDYKNHFRSQDLINWLFGVLTIFLLFVNLAIITYLIN